MPRRYHNGYWLDDGATEEAVGFGARPANGRVWLMPKMETVAITAENDEEEPFKAPVRGISEKDYAACVEQCKGVGFDTVADEKSMHRSLHDADGSTMKLTCCSSCGYWYARVTPPETWRFALTDRMS